MRLFANFFAGHLLLVVFFVGTAYLVASPPTIPFAAAAFVLSVFLVGLEVFHRAVRMGLETTAVYIQLSVSHEH